MRLKQDSIIALKPEFFEFLEIRSSQAPSACADVRIVESSSETDPLAVNGSWPGDNLSGGRVEVGLGLGYAPMSFEALDSR